MNGVDNLVDYGAGSLRELWCVLTQPHTGRSLSFSLDSLENVEQWSYIMDWAGLPGLLLAHSTSIYYRRLHNAKNILPCNNNPMLKIISSILQSYGTRTWLLLLYPYFQIIQYWYILDPSITMGGSKGDTQAVSKTIKPLSVRYNDNRKTLKYYKEQLKMKSRRSRLLIIAIADKLNEKEREIAKVGHSKGLVF